MKAYTIKDHLHYKGQFKMHLDLEMYKEMTQKGMIDASFNTLAARLLCMDYPTFLKMIRQDYGAELHGKEGRYVFYSFKDKKKAVELTKILNQRWKQLIKDKNK